MSSAIESAAPLPYSKLSEVESLVARFESCMLPREEWTHRAHLTVALWYLVQHEEAEAEELIRAGIQRFNHASGILTTRTSGYHETITLFYIRVIRNYLRGANASDSVFNLVNGLIETYGDRNLPFEYYSRERLMSPGARMSWVEPDLKRLD
ncbi:MAG: hypothetical protein M3362_11580 [Acidobacteriota bacterium]|nr:hypothetical protein [Acidobacteriota bacterium]